MPIIEIAGKTIDVNEEGFLTAENGDRVIDLLDPLITAGYRIHLRKIIAFICVK